MPPSTSSSRRSIWRPRTTFRIARLARFHIAPDLAAGRLVPVLEAYDPGAAEDATRCRSATRVSHRESAPSSISSPPTRQWTHDVAAGLDVDGSRISSERYDRLGRKRMSESPVDGGSGAPVGCVPGGEIYVRTCSHTLEMTTDPSPTEAATRLTELARTSPTAKIPGCDVA